MVLIKNASLSMLNNKNTEQISMNGKKMKIAVIWKNDYPWDVRIEKICISLKKAGHEIFLLSSNVNQMKRYEEIDGINVCRLPYCKNKKINRLVSIPSFLNLFWFYLINKTIRKNKIELLIVRDLPLIPIGLLFKKIYNLPLILDMAENYPALYSEIIKMKGRKALITFFTKNPWLIKKIEDYAVRKVDHTLTVVEESKNRIAKFKKLEKKISIVSNTPIINNDKYIANLTGNKEEISLIYVGYVQYGRGLDTVVNAIKKIKNNYSKKIKFYIVGDGYYLENLRDKVNRDGLQENIYFTGWINNDRINDIIDNCDIGVIPHMKDNHSDTTIPNKLFDFMARSKPVIVSNTIPMERIVHDCKCGLSYEAMNENSFIEIFNMIVQDEKQIEIMGLNGRNAVEKKYNWGNDFRTLLRVINNINKNVKN